MVRFLSVLAFALAVLTAAPPASATGPLPEALRSAGVTQAEWDALQAEVRAAAQRARVSERALAAVAERLSLVLAQDGRRIAVGDIMGQLDALATRIAELELRLAAIARDEDPSIAALVNLARAAIQGGELEVADEALAEARGLRAERNALLQTQLNAGRLEEAAIVAAQGEVALLRADFLAAAALFDEAAELAPEGTRERWQYRMGQATALYQRGLRFEIAHLREAARIFRDLALPLASRETRPDDWSVTQNDLANALSVLGHRGEPGALDQAVVALEAALSVASREQNPHAWATMQMNLGIAYSRQGERGAPGALDRAVAAYQTALSAISRDANPGTWALIQMNLGAARQIQGMRGEPGAIEAAVAAFEDALNIVSRETHATMWAVTQMNLGMALSVLGERGAPGALDRAVAAYEAALTVLTRESHAAGWAHAQMSLGNARLAQARTGAPDALDQAIAAYEAALTVFTRDSDPPAWALTQMNLGNALSMRAYLGAPGAFDRAVDAFEASLSVRTRAADPAGWAETTFNLAYAYGSMGRIAEARTAMRAAIDGFDQVANTLMAQRARALLARLPPE